MDYTANNAPMQANAQNRRDGRWFLAWILGFFLVFASVDAFMIYMAVNTHTGEVQSSEGDSAKAKPKWRRHDTNTPNAVPSD